MSIAICQFCDDFIDTDCDPEALLDHGTGCVTCRERERVGEFECVDGE